MSSGRTAEGVTMADYASGDGCSADDRVLEWESGLPAASDLTPLSQPLIPPELATAFNISLEPSRTLVDVNRASQQTLSGLWGGGQQSNFADHSFKQLSETNNSKDLMVEDDADEGSGTRTIRRIKSTEEADSELRAENSNHLDDQKRHRLVWTPQLHKRFVDVVSHLGIKRAVPKTIMKLMNVEGLTRENVASHLQKYRLYMKNMQGMSNGGALSSDHLFASTPALYNLQECANPMMPIRMPYGPAMTSFPMYGAGNFQGNVGGHMGIPMGSHGNGNYSGMDAQHQHAYGMMQPMNWNFPAVSHHHYTAPGQK